MTHVSGTRVEGRSSTYWGGVPTPILKVLQFPSLPRLAFGATAISQTSLRHERRGVTYNSPLGMTTIGAGSVSDLTSVTEEKKKKKKSKLEAIRSMMKAREGQ